MPFRIAVAKRRRNRRLALRGYNVALGPPPPPRAVVGVDGILITRPGGSYDFNREEFR